MQLNGYIVLGIALLLFGGSMQLAVNLPPMPDGGGQDITPPEYDINQIMPEACGSYAAISFAWFSVRDLESAIVSVELSIGNIDNTQTVSYSLRQVVWSVSGWTGWEYDFSPSLSTPGAYRFQFIATNGAGLKSEVVSNFTIQAAAPPSPQTGALEITFTVNGQTTQSPALFQVIHPNGTNTEHFGNDIVLSSIQVGRYTITGHYNGLTQVQTADVQAGQITKANLDFTISQGTTPTNTQPQFPIEPTATNVHVASEIFPTAGLVVIVGAAVLAMGLQKKLKEKPR